MFSTSASQVSSEANYIESVFSTYLYTGTGANQTITNNIDLSTNGGLVWIKGRSGATNHILNDTARGLGPDSKGNELSTNLDSAAFIPSAAQTASVTSFLSNGFTIGDGGRVNTSSATYVSWTFRKQAKFFDVVTYTGTGSARTIAHNLGSVPGFMVVKRTDVSDQWYTYHTSLGALTAIPLNSNDAASAWTPVPTVWNSSAPTSTVFSVGTDSGVNANGGTYVAYLFAHNAGGFGLTGNDNVISCGSFTHNNTIDQEINLGWETQWLLLKTTSSGVGWSISDIMRGSPTGANAQLLFANDSGAEFAGQQCYPTSVGFKVRAGAYLNGATIAYIAIRRGPMKVPTSGTSVFSPIARSGTGANATVTGGAGVSDAVLIKYRSAAVGNLFVSRLTGTGYLETSSTSVENSAGTTTLQANPWDVMDGVKVGTTSTNTNAGGNAYINYLFDRAPGFFDQVFYTGTGVARTVTHNLAAAPELMIVKSRSYAATNWSVYVSSGGGTKFMRLDTTLALSTSTAIWNDTNPTSSVFTVGTHASTNQSAETYVAYLFATCAGVSKVGSYTGTGATQTIDCGFTGGARFVLIKRTDTTGDWYVWDSARGIVAGNDPYLLLNSTAADVFNTDYVDTYSAGFEISSTAPAAINANGGTFIFLAIA